MSNQDFFNNIRKDFPALEMSMNGKPPVYLDSA
jgi:selenocysteine lyase/cysteine desulfurase